MAQTFLNGERHYTTSVLLVWLLGGCLAWDEQANSAKTASSSDGAAQALGPIDGELPELQCITDGGRCSTGESACDAQAGKCRMVDFEAGSQDTMRFFCVPKIEAQCVAQTGPSEEEPGSTNHVFRSEIGGSSQRAKYEWGWTINRRPSGDIVSILRAEVSFDYWAPEALDGDSVAWFEIVYRPDPTDTELHYSFGLKSSSSGTKLYWNEQTAHRSEYFPNPRAGQWTRVVVVLEYEAESWKITASYPVPNGRVTLSLSDIVLPHGGLFGELVQVDGNIGLNRATPGVLQSASYDNWISATRYGIPTEVAE